MKIKKTFLTFTKYVDNTFDVYQVAKKEQNSVHVLYVNDKKFSNCIHY